MTTMKKLVALLLAAMMLLAVMNVAVAEGTLTGGSITINDAISGQTYNAYQILYLESYDAQSGVYSYKANSAWADWLATQTDYVKIDPQGYVTWVDGADVADFAALAKTQLSGKTVAATATASSETVTLSSLNLGYYLLDTTLGALCSLDTTNPNVVMEEKNEVPTITKEVQEDSDSSWGETNDADVNQTVNYQATITVKAGAENYVLYDKMSEGLNFNSDVIVKIGETVVDASNYTVSENVTGGEGENAQAYTFAVEFKNEYISTLAAGTEIVVTYSATLNEKAQVGLTGNPNEVILKYGDESKPSWTPKDETITYTWDMKVVKYTNVTTTTTVEGEELQTKTQEVPLANATFKLCTDTAGEKVMKFHDLGENKYEVCAKEDCTVSHVTEITTDLTGTFDIEGLDADTYYLFETAAPAGYNKLAGAVTVTITGATKAEGSDTLSYSTVETKVENKSGTELPSTGGIGTTIFYVVGGVLVLLAVVLLVTKRRVGEEN
ncbi:MAG: SpaH/EbpB family LPXTG-anchored major pilin [Clostridia bacterium]|nr:SpaH/EbpB family LPXTG-anchored major pilin [Clostridia bacterium]